MKAIIEVEFEIDEGNHFSVENIAKAIESNLEIRGVPLSQRTTEGNLTVRISQAEVIEIDNKKV